MINARIVILSVLILLSFQNCSPINFTSPSSKSTPVDGSSLEHGHGEIFTGTVRYVIPDIEEVCTDNEILREIEQAKNDYYLTVDNCDRLNEPEKLEEVHISDQGIIFDQQLFVDSNENYEEELESFPKSCQEIFQAGDSLGNGHYLIRSGESENKVISTFCNMEILKQL